VSERVFLVGLMGSGKSTVGRLLAGELGRPYVDNDATIAALAGRSTVDLARAGGTTLHEWEARYAQHLVQAQPAPFVAGVPASSGDRPDELDALAATGLLVYLDVPVDVLVERVLADPPRPWLTESPGPLLRRLHASRHEVLRRHSTLVVDGTRAPALVAGEVLAALPGAGRR
jgi:shikimate kinase